MKIFRFFVICVILLFLQSCFSTSFYRTDQEYIKKYSYKEEWFISDAVGGNSIYEIKIKTSSKNENTTTDEIQAELFHTITPFSQSICTDITLKLTNNKKYVFSFTDAWNNKAFGWIKFGSKEIELYLDCNEFDETGKNFARLYGETIKLHETTDDKDFLKNALEEK